MLGEKTHRYIFLFGVCALAFGMMMGTVPTSVPQIILMGNWLLEGQFRRKWSGLKNNKLFWIMASVFLIHVLGLFYTADLQAGWNDVRTKLPMIFLPMLFFTTEPLTLKEMRALLHFFLLGTLTNTLWCITYTHLLHKNEEVRNASRFMSHIRLGLYLNIAIAVSVSFFRKSATREKLLYALLILYFIFCLYVLGLASGMVNFVMLVFIFLCVVIYRQKNLLRLSFAVLLLAFVSGVAWYVSRVADEQLKPVKGGPNELKEFTSWGSRYTHFAMGGQKENGVYVLMNIQVDEIRRAWNARVPQDTFSYVPQHNLQRYEVLVRYLASKGLNKDSLGMQALTDEDLKNIQHNIVNYKIPGWSFLHRRLYEAVCEYDEFMNGRHVNGHSVSMRLYFWKAALHVARQQVWTGVGTGDVQAAMNAAYVETQSPLNEDWYKRPHNQFLTVLVALGITGLLVFLLSVFYPAWHLRKDLPNLYWTFLLVAIVSFIVEDTLETQAGQTFYAFFNSLWISQASFTRSHDSARL